MKQPLFSVCHTTARVPDGWVRSYEHWMRECFSQERVEYILCVDAEHEASVRTFIDRHNFAVTLVVNGGRQSAVAGWNRAAEAAQGKILICNADDCFAPHHWDQRLVEEIHRVHKSFDEPFVIHVGTESPRDETLMAFSFLSAARYNQLGYVFWPEYIGMYGDDDFTEHAYRDGVVIDARHLVFRHEHPVMGTAKNDAIYQRQNRPEAYRIGQEIFARRKQAGFPPLPWRTTAQRKRIALCMPGENFSSRWVMSLLGLTKDLERMGYEVLPPFNCFSSDVSVTREELRQAVLKCEPKPDLVLWLDDDNLINAVEVAQLALDLETFPELDAVFAWCWIGVDDYSLPAIPSCGRLKTSRKGEAFTPREMWDWAKAGNLKALGYSGFPAVLMKLDLLTKIGEFPFAPFVGPDLDHGKSGEDFAFCSRAVAAGCKLVVDPRVKIPHIKRGAYEPDLSKVLEIQPPRVTEMAANAAD